MYFSLYICSLSYVYIHIYIYREICTSTHIAMLGWEAMSLINPLRRPPGMQTGPPAQGLQEKAGLIGPLGLQTTYLYVYVRYIHKYICMYMYINVCMN